MFNLRRIKKAVDVSKKVNPKDIPGTTLEEKARYISDKLNNAVATEFLEGRKTEQQIIDMLSGETAPENIEQVKSTYPEEDIYKILGDKPLPQNLEQFEGFRQNIDALRRKAGQLLRENGATQPTEEVVNSIVAKLMERIRVKFIPSLVELNRVDKRTEEMVTPLLEYTDPEEIQAIRNFIAVEILKRRLAIRDEFLEILKASKVFNPSMTISNLIAIMETPIENIVDIELPLTEIQAREIKEALNILDRDVKQKQSNIRIWNRILAVHPDIKDREKWANLIPEDLRIQWTLESVLRYLGFPVSVKANPRVEAPREMQAAKKEGIMAFFFPETGDNGEVLESPEQQRTYALGKLRQCVENDYDNERIFSALSISIKKQRKQKRTQQQIEQDKEQGLEVVDEPVTIKEANDSDGEKIRYWFKYITKLGSTASVFDPSVQLAAFRKDLREAGCPAVAELLGMAYEKQEDKRYQEFDLKFLSTEEMNMCLKLRQYGLDPIPFPIKIPAPVDCPTSERFEIDFLMPCDVLVNFGEQEILGDIDPETGERQVTYIVQPIIEHQIMFIGEYFGIRLTMEKKIADRGKSWVKPNGSLPIYQYENTKGGPSRYIVAPIGPCREMEFYKLKTEWKEFAYEVISSMLNTRTLSLDDSDLEYQKPLFEKLNAKGIIYNHPSCKAIDLINQVSTTTDYTLQYTTPERFEEKYEDMEERMQKIIDCAILNVQVSEGLVVAKNEFVHRDTDDKPGFFNVGFNRQTMFKHKEEVDKLLQRRKILSMQISALGDNVTKNKLDAVKFQLSSLIGSPLHPFVEYFRDILENQESAIGKKISALKDLKQIVKQGKISSFTELRQTIIDISPELIGQLAQRGVDFPEQPSIGQVFNADNVVWTWDGKKWNPQQGK